MKRLAGRQFYRMVVVTWLTFSIGSVVLAALCWWNLSSLMAQGRQLSAVRDATDGIFKSLLDSEMGTEGYVITGDTNYLAAFSNATNTIPSQFNNLAELAEEDPSFVTIITDMRGRADSSLDWQKQIIAARDRGFGKAADLVGNGQAKQIMDGIRDQINELDRLRADKISNIREQLNRQVYRANLTSLAAGAAGVGAGIIAYWLSQIFLRQQRRERELTE